MLGWSIERGKARRLVENIAQQAEQYVEQRLTAEVIKSQQQPNTTYYKMLVELDGSHIRTGVKKDLESAQLTPLRQLNKCSRQIDISKNSQSLLQAGFESSKYLPELLLTKTRQ